MQRIKLNLNLSYVKGRRLQQNCKRGSLRRRADASQTYCIDSDDTATFTAPVALAITRKVLSS
jgi:hypothetical protein